MDNIVIRKAIVSDAAGIAEIHIRSWQSAYKGIVPQDHLDSLDMEERVKSWENGLETPSCPSMVRLVALFNKQIVGFSCIGKSRETDMPEHGELYAIYMTPDFYGRSVGYGLFRESMKELMKQGYEKAYVAVLKDNQRGIKFYERTGASLIKDSDFTIDIGGKTLTEVHYEWSNLKGLNL